MAVWIDVAALAHEINGGTCPPPRLTYRVVTDTTWTRVVHETKLDALLAVNTTS
jgi:hypothetical protein